MAVNRQGLSDFLLQQGVPQDKVKNAMALVEPLFLVAEGKRKILLPPTEETKPEVLAALQGLFGQEQARKVLLVSSSEPFARPEWMTEESYQKAVQATLVNTLGATLMNTLLDTLEDTLGDMLWVMLGAKLEDMLRVTLVNTLLNMLWGTLEDTLWDMLWGTLFFYFGFLLAGEEHEERVAKLAALTQVIAKVWLPFGVKSDEPGCWLVMVA